MPPSIIIMFFMLWNKFKIGRFLGRTGGLNDAKEICVIY